MNKFQQEFKSKYTFQTRKCIWKDRLQNGGHSSRPQRVPLVPGVHCLSGLGWQESMLRLPSVITLSLAWWTAGQMAKREKHNDVCIPKQVWNDCLGQHLFNNILFILRTFINTLCANEGVKCWWCFAQNKSFSKRHYFLECGRHQVLEEKKHIRHRENQP